MTVGTSDGKTYSDSFSHLIDEHIGFEVRAEPVKKAIASGDFDPVGGNYTEFNSSGRTEANFEAATKEMKLTPQEQGLYKRHLDNLWGSGGVDNPDGTRSSLYTSTVTFGDKAYIVPGVHEGRILSHEEADTKAKAEGLDSLPSYSTHEEANKRYQQLHDYMEKDTNAYERYRQNRMPPGASEKPVGEFKSTPPTLPTKVISDALPERPVAGQQYAMADMAPEGMRIPVARVQQSIKDQFGGGRGGGSWSFEMKKPANTNRPKDAKETPDQYIERIKSGDEYKKIVEERKAEIAKGAKEGRNTPDGQIIDPNQKYNDALLDQQLNKFKYKGPETRDSHSTPFSKLTREQQEMWSKHVKDPEVRKSLGIPEGPGADIIPFLPK